MAKWSLGSGKMSSNINYRYAFHCKLKILIALETPQSLPQEQQETFMFLCDNVLWLKITNNQKVG